jgi:asparagine synthetase B (glutamine-hydrolysing)
MCGLAGFAFPKNSPSPLPDVKTALKDLTHRGPDDEGFFNFYRCNFRLFVILNKLIVS